MNRSRALISSSDGSYYSLLQAVREKDAGEDWALYMLTPVEATARQVFQVARITSR